MSTPIAADTATTSSMPPPLVSPAARRWALILLFSAYVVNYVDRQVVAILQDPIKRELGLSDTQLGLLTGLSFALFYAAMGVPIARLADVRSRKTIISVAMVLWSFMTALCGAANSFVTLLLCRIGVGVGEAGLTPPAHSLISDYYEPERRGGALAIYSAAGTVGLMVGFLAGGWINQFFGWRAAILVVGVPGLVLAALVWLTLREPRRGQFDSLPGQAAAHDAGSGSALLALARNPAFRCIALACGFHTFVNFGQGNWTPPFYGRLHGMTSGEIGTWLALLSVGPGLIGMLSAGYFSDWLARRRPNGRLETAMGCMLLIIPFELAAFLAPHRLVSLVTLAGAFFFAGGYLAPCIAAAHSMMPANLRASASAMIMLAVNLIGLGVGPLAVGLLSDHWMAAGGGPESLRHAMLAIVPAELIGAALIARAIVHIGRAKAAIR
ncbi:MFS transporter [Sphingomonas naphthae]|uniref:MFS transporter n=1 Tax=Sphingomonas naphthae TaxID=1813468 RepID=A0ABY7TKH9_9SPHN|nr:MFS transporter [Sphingomonas naphthae]WCT73455.1 MFS transporter [Sphingomonas naphthae]